MSQSAITTAFETYLAAQVAEGQPVTLDQFIFANVPGLDPDAPINRVTEVVPVENVVYQQDVTLPGLINENEVVYSVTMGTDVGDFDFNWIGLVNKSTGLLGMVTHAPVQQKFKNADGQQGNTLTRSFLMEYDGAATATNITTPAETWQIDFTARLAGMDERERLENTDIYGEGAFFGDGFLITGNPTNGYQITAGVGYVGGLRVSLSTTQAVAISAKPTMVWVDACWKGTLTSVWQTVIGITVATSLEDYLDEAGLQHYVFAVASVDASGAITDLRPKGSQDGQQFKDYLRIDQNLSEIAGGGATAQQAARNNLGLKSAATHDVSTSHSDVTAGHMLMVGDGGLLGQALSATDANLVNKDGLVSMLFSQGGGSGSIRFGGYGCGVHLNYGSSGDGSQSLSANLFVDSSGNLFVEWLAIKKSDGSIVAQKIQKLWGPLNKPTAADVGALPLKTSSLSVDLNTLGAASSAGLYCQQSNAGATTAFHYPLQEAGALLVSPSAYGAQQEYTAFASGRKFVRGLNSTFTNNGPWHDWVEILTIPTADGRYYTKAQSDAAYMPKTGAYTKSESDARYAMNPNVAGWGGVGTYAFLSCNTAQSNGSTVAGSALYASGVGGQKSASGWGDKSIIQQGSTMAGTWKCCGNQPAVSGNDVGATLYFRIS